MRRRRGFEQQISLQDRIIAWANEVRTEAAAMPPGPDRDGLLQKVQQAETAMHLDSWANTPGLSPSK